jgi:hypothetical protein
VRDAERIALRAERETEELEVRSQNPVGIEHRAKGIGFKFRNSNFEIR